MPFFSPKTWKQRIVEFPGRRRLDDTSSADVYDVSRAEGTVIQEGDGFTAANMNDLEQRINNAVNDVAGLSADEYDPNATYSSGDLRIHDNILHKANQDISVAEPWTPAHWELTTLAAELSAVNSSSTAPMQIREGYSVWQSINHIDKCGKNAHMMLGLSLKSGMTSWVVNEVADIPEGYRPQYYPSLFAITRNGIWCCIDCSNGRVSIQPFAESVQQGDSIIIDTSWVCE